MKCPQLTSLRWRHDGVLGEASQAKRRRGLPFDRRVLDGLSIKYVYTNVGAKVPIDA